MFANFRGRLGHFSQVVVEILYDSISKLLRDNCEGAGLVSIGISAGEDDASDLDWKKENWIFVSSMLLSLLSICRYIQNFQS